MVTEINIAQLENTIKLPHARISEWHDTNVAEIKCFIGILIWISLSQFSSIESYWYKSSRFQNNISFNLMGWFTSLTTLSKSAHIKFFR